MNNIATNNEIFQILYIFLYICKCEQTTRVQTRYIFYIYKDIS